MNKYLSGSATLMSAVLVGFVPVSKLNAFGLSECGDAVVELANHNFESAVGLAIDDAVEPVADDEFVPEIALLLPVIWVASAILPVTAVDSVVVALPPLVTLT